jgi:hypothetical protein
MSPLRHGNRGASQKFRMTTRAASSCSLFANESKVLTMQFVKNCIFHCLCCTHGYLYLIKQKLSLQSIRPA